MIARDSRLGQTGGIGLTIGVQLASLPLVARAEINRHGGSPDAPRSRGTCAW
jgi:hypothetical protein